MAFLLNTWYVAGWARELEARPVGRTLLNEPVVLYRKTNGVVAALADRCPHRFAPLRLGRLAGDNIECGYHGLQFDSTGACVHNPHSNGPIPATCRVRSYPAFERHGAIWFWPGDPALARPETIPDFSYITESGRKTIFGGARVKAHYELISDNLMDASHTQYVHKDVLGTAAFKDSKHEVIQEGDTVHSNYLIPNGIVPPAFRSYFRKQDLLVNYSVRFRWAPPALVRNNVTVTPLEGDEPEYQRIGSHFMTPETDTTTHYFFAHTRNFALDDPEADARSRWWQEHGLTLQDVPMIEAVQQSMGTTDLDSLRPHLLSIDTAAIRARRSLKRLIGSEREANVN